MHQAVKVTAAAADLFRRPRPGVVILIFHRVGGASGLDVDQPVELFERQIEVLAAAGCVVPLEAAIRTLAGDARPSKMEIVVSFDDGTADFADYALPVLVRYRIPVTLYLATRFTDEVRRYPDGAVPVSWSALADACSTGLVDIGSHTHNHVLLDRLGPADVEDELERSIGVIGEKLGRPAYDFAYPKAVAPSLDADRAVRARFRSAALGGTRVNIVGATDMHRLARSPVQRSDGMMWFRRKSAGGMTLEDHLRRLLNRRRYAQATT